MQPNGVHDLSTGLKGELERIAKLFTVPTEQLRKITTHFAKELETGLSAEGQSLPAIPTWCTAFPTGLEQGEFLALDMGGTNMRVCEIKLLPEKGKFSMVQSKYRIPEPLKTGTGNELWAYIAECLEKFLIEHHGENYQAKIPLGFTFSYPASQDYINHGVLQRWTKGFDISGVEGTDVVPPFEAALQERGLHIKLTALINDTVGTMIASAYVDDRVKIGCIFGTGCNAAYMDRCGSIPKLASKNLDNDLPMTINIEWGAFDNEHAVLPLTPYDVIIDKASPRPGQQAFEKMIAGLYLGELFRLVLLEIHGKALIFDGQDATQLKIPYILDSSLLEDKDSVANSITEILKFTATASDIAFCWQIAYLIGTRAARLSACGIAGICTKNNWSECHVGADGSLFHKYSGFKVTLAAALREILGWADGEADKVVMVAAEDGSGVGAALIAALTLERVQAGIWAGIKDPQAVLAAMSQ